MRSIRNEAESGFQRQIVISSNRSQLILTIYKVSKYRSIMDLYIYVCLCAGTWNIQGVLLFKDIRICMYMK